MIRFGRIFKFSVCSPTGAECKPSPTEPILSGITLRHISPKNRANPKDAYQTRVQRSVLSPYTVRLIDNAAGLILRRPIEHRGRRLLDHLERKCRWPRILPQRICAPCSRFFSVLTATAGILVDFPSRPWSHHPLSKNANWDVAHTSTTSIAYDIWGWRQETPNPELPAQAKSASTKWTTIPEGTYGQKRVERIRVIYARPATRSTSAMARSYGVDPGTLDACTVHSLILASIDSGALPFNQIPFVPIYTNRTGMLTSSARR